MSKVLWIKLENDSGKFDPDDLACMYNELDELDQQCSRLGVAPLSKFIEGEEAKQQKLVDAAELSKTLRTLKNARLHSGEEDDLLDEIRFAIRRCDDAEKAGVAIRLIAVS